MVKKHLVLPAFVLVLAACGGNATDSPAAVPTRQVPDNETPRVWHQLAADLCAGAFSGCQAGALPYLEALQPNSGTLLAVCDYGDDQGDVMLIDSREDADEQCSASGTITPSSVTRVVEVP
jgi:hypothetical protein